MMSLASKIIILFLLHLSSFVVLGESPSPDAEALLQFKAQCDVHPNLQSWSNSTINRTCAAWKGVKCNENNRVVELDLSSMQLSCDVSKLQTSPLPEELTTLSLADNNFTGPIDRLLASLIPDPCKLEALDLSGNSLSGSWNNIAGLNSCKVTLTALNLSRNHLEGDVDLLGGFDIASSRLRSLDLSHNNFTGSQLAPGNSLHRLHLSNNKFSGLKVSPEACSSLEELDISYNFIADFTTLSLCKSLKKLNLANNMPAGTVFFPIWEPLEWVDASGNGFTGSIDRLAVPKTLKFLDLSFNKLALGDSSSSSSSNRSLCSSDSELTGLLLSNNTFNGKIPDSILTCSNLQTLDLSSNPSFSGLDSTGLCTKLPKLQELIIAETNLNEEIPLELTKCSQLRVLLLNNNRLTGSIPPEIEQLSELHWLSLSNNELTGIIPPSLGNIKNLTFLELSNNHLEGHIPDTFAANSSNILWLDLSRNSLTGSVPPRFGFKGQSMKFPTEFLSGVGKMGFVMNPPSCSGGLGRLILIHESSNEEPFDLAGNCKPRFYPISSYNLSRPISTAVFLDLSYNNLNGEVPESIGEISDLTMMNLRSNNFTGLIPSRIGMLKNLLLLDLSHNRFEGELPDSLCDLTFLSSLNVSFNNLSGMIPPKGQLTTFSSESYQGNLFLCGVPLNTTCKDDHPAPVATRNLQAHAIAQQLLVVILVSGILFLGAAAWWIWWKRSKSLTSKSTDNDFPGQSSHRGPQTGGDQPVRMTYPEIKQATQNFQFLIGSGGSAEVFEAQLPDGSSIAVKRLISSLAFHEFLAEIETLGKLRHPNLVPLLAFCARGDEHFLVYPLMSKGSLETLLSNPAVKIPWNMRKRIATDAARGLCFLHHTCVPHIVHRDVTSANVLLDDAWNARLADFGMARLMLDGLSGGKSDYVSVTTLWGTPGYVPPEYYQSFFRCTRGGDVYSFGVILLELLTRKRATGKEEFGESNLVGWVKGRKSVEEVLEPELRSSSGAKEVEEMIGFVRLAMVCVEDRPHKRPSMLEMVARLKELSIES